MKKSVTNILFVVFSVLFLAACGRRESPEQIVTTVYHAAARADYEAALEHLSTLDFFNMVQETGSDYYHPAWIEFWETVVPVDDIDHIVFEEVRRHRAWTKVYMTIITPDGQAVPHEQLLMLQDKVWRITLFEFEDPALERRN